MAIDKRVFPLRLDKDLYFSTKQAAEDDKRSMNKFIEIAIEKELIRIKKVKS